MGDGSRFAFHLDVVPIGRAESRFPIDATLAEYTFQTDTRSTVTSEVVNQLVCRNTFFQSFVQGRGMGRKTIVVTPLHDRVIGIGTNQSDFHVFFQRQDIIPILQEDNAFSCNFQC